jgi:hypothetical protein
MDQAGVYSQIVDWLKDQPVIKDNGGMQMSGPSLGAKSTALVVRRVLHGFVTAAAEGEKALAGNKNEEIRNPRTNRDNIEEIRDQILVFLTLFAAAMGDRFHNRDSIHLTRTGWEAIGVIANDCIGQQSPEAVAARLAAVDWSRSNEAWFGMIGSAEKSENGDTVLDGEGRPRVVISGGKGDQGLRLLIKHLRNLVGTKSKQEMEAK